MTPNQMLETQSQTGRYQYTGIITTSANDCLPSSAPAVTPAESGFESDDLSQTEKEHRRAMEYLEPEEPGVVVEQVREASVPIPNIPVPRSSDGQVCNIVLLPLLHANTVLL